jgi:hypothetical protein
MLETKDMKWNIDKDKIVDPTFDKWRGDYDGAKAQMQQRTKNYELYGLIAKNKSIHELANRAARGKTFSEGSAQYILRKSLANTIQRVPDGELLTQYDKASVEHVQIQYIFENKVLWSEFEGIDMLSNITSTFKYAFTYGFAPIRTGFEKDFDEDVRITYTIENWADIFVNRDCKDIRRPQTVWHRSYMSKADVEALLNEQGNVRDTSYVEDTIKYVIDHDEFTGKQAESEKLADKLQGSSSLASLELLTRYDRGASEFVTYVPSLKAIFRKVKNEDPRKEIPWDFFVLEVDTDFPLGLPQIEFLLADQQFLDLFQSSAFKNLLLAMEPPIMVGGWETNPASYRFEPRKIWNLGNNPNQAKVEPVKIDNAVLAQFLTTREGISASMLRSLNVMDGTLAKDSGIADFSGTPQGVEAQTKSKEVSTNQYQKRIEYFFANWANKALRMYVNAQGGTHKLTVDEKTRRLLFDLEKGDLLDGNKIEIDFSALSADLLTFQVRTGSLVEKKEDQERKALADFVQPVVQNLNGWSEQNKATVENEILLPALKRMLELSDTDIGQGLAGKIDEYMTKRVLMEQQQQLQAQQAQIDGQQAQLDGLTQGQPAMPDGIAPPVDQQVPGMGETSPSSAPMPAPPLPPMFQESAGEDVNQFPQ